MKNKILLLVLIGIIITGMVVGPDYSHAYTNPEAEMNPSDDIIPTNYKQFSDMEMSPVQTHSVSSVWDK